MQLIAVDIGNSSTKIAAEPVKGDERWTDHITIRGKQPIELDLAPKKAVWSICSVNRKRLDLLLSWIETNRPEDKVHEILATDIELASDVESREQVGRDRLVAAEMAVRLNDCLLYTSPSPRDATLSRMPSSA